jgi:hypothetical protein
MKLCIYSLYSGQYKPTSLIGEETTVTQWKILAWPDFTLWTDADDTDDSETDIRKYYLEPNGIRAESLTKVESRFWAVHISPDAMNDFYNDGEPGAETSLAWRTLYTFTSKSTGKDCISKGFDYVPNDDIRSVLLKVISR